MTAFIKNPQPLRIPRQEWYESLQRDISPLFRPNPVDSAVALRLMELENTPEAIRFFAAYCHALTNYGYWFFLGVCWVQYTGRSDLALWKRLFSSERPHRDACLMKPTERRLFNGLPKIVHCYRVHRADEQEWVSYTLDRDTATKLAVVRGINQIHEYRIPRKRLLCLFLRRHEYEVLCLETRYARNCGVIEVKEREAWLF